MTGELLCGSDDAMLAVPRGTGEFTGQPARSWLPGADLASLTAEQLAERTRMGCRDSFELLVAQFQARIFNFLLQLTRNRHDAEDLTQETFIKAFRGIHRFDPQYRVATWLFTIAKRTAISHFRSVDPIGPPSDAHELDHVDPSTLLVAKEQRGSLWQLARALKPQQFDALWLCYGEDFSVSETARIMKTTQIHVKVLLYRGRGRLRKLLAYRRPDLLFQDSAGNGTPTEQFKAD